LLYNANGYMIVYIYSYDTDIYLLQNQIECMCDYLAQVGKLAGQWLLCN